MSEWVLCEKTKPPVNHKVLLFIRDSCDAELVIGEWNGSGYYLEEINLEEFIGPNVIAWTLLPEVPAYISMRSIKDEEG